MTGEEWTRRIIMDLVLWAVNSWWLMLGFGVAHGSLSRTVPHPGYFACAGLILGIGAVTCEIAHTTTSVWRSK